MALDGASPRDPLVAGAGRLHGQALLPLLEHVGSRPPGPIHEDLSPSQLLPLRLQLPVMLSDERSDLVRYVEDAGPLLLVERDREPTEPVEGDRALGADLERDSGFRLPLEALVLPAQALELWPWCAAGDSQRPRLAARCVRPIFTTSSNSSALRAEQPHGLRRAGLRSSWMAWRAAADMFEEREESMAM